MDNKDSSYIYIIETCENCKSHTWNTRHDEAKYLQYAQESKNYSIFINSKYL